MLRLKALREALQAIRSGEKGIDLSTATIPWSGGRIAKAAGDVADQGEGSRVRSVIWSDRAVDEDNDTIEPSGWDLTRFLKQNGPILWAHDSRSLPIGSQRDTRVEGQGPTGKLLGGIAFSEENPWGELVMRLVDEGVLNGASVGFRPTKWIYNEERGGIDFLEQRLMEGTICPVGSNPTAMVEAAKAKSLDMAPMVEWVEECLDDEDIYTASPRAELEVIHKALGPWRKTPAGVVVPVPALPAADPTPGEIGHAKIVKEAADLLGVMVESVKSGELPREIFDAPLAALGLAAESRGAITWDEAHPNGTPRAPKDAEWDWSSDCATEDADDGDGCAWKSADGGKLGHHRTRGSVVVWRGLTEAMDDLLSDDANIPEPDRRAVYDHLARHYRDDFDEEPPEFRAVGEEPAPTADQITEMVTAAAIEVAREIQGDREDLSTEIEEAVRCAVEELKRENLRESGRLPA